jgi:hypothetical protein
LQLLLSLLENLVASNILPARCVHWWYMKIALLERNNLIKIMKFMSEIELMETSKY